MRWNYRLIDMSHEYGEPWVELFEVYYGDDDSLMGYASANTGGSDAATLKQSLKWMQLALTKPVLKVEDFEADKEK